MYLMYWYLKKLCKFSSLIFFCEGERYKLNNKLIAIHKSTSCKVGQDFVKLYVDIKIFIFENQETKMKLKTLKIFFWYC